jgi:citrate lyase subunit beta/citryl-CoA lyase
MTRWSVPGPALLFCPGDRPERFAKAVAAADGVILDLEDAVGAEQKPTARTAAVEALDRLPPDRVVVRINAVGTPWHADDITALAIHARTVVMLPMAASPADVQALAPHPVIALCETAAGVLAADSIARADNCVGVMWGSEDLLVDLGGRPGRTPTGGYRPAVEFARSRVLYAARAARVEPIDSVSVDLDDTATLRADGESAADSGFAAKACIHPRQCEVVRQAFTPTDEELAWARGVLDAARSRTGAFRHHGRMVDEPVLAHARVLLRRGPPRSE